MSVTKFSASKLKTYKTCPRQYHYIYDLSLIQRPSDALILGTRYHSIVRQLSLNEPIEDIKPTKDATLFGLIKKYKEHPVQWTVVDTEKRFEIILDDILIVWYWDRLNTDCTIEYKTTSTDYKKEDVDNFQTDIYILARYLIMWELLPLYYHVNNKKKINSKKYQPQLIRVDKCLEDLEDIKKNIVQTIHKILNKEFEATPWNHCFWCPFGTGYNWTNNCLEYEKFSRENKKIILKKSK